MVASAAEPEAEKPCHATTTQDRSETLAAGGLKGGGHENLPLHAGGLDRQLLRHRSLNRATVGWREGQLPRVAKGQRRAWEVVWSVYERTSIHALLRHFGAHTPYPHTRAASSFIIRRSTQVLTRRGSMEAPVPSRSTDTPTGSNFQGLSPRMLSAQDTIASTLLRSKD